MGLNYKKLMRQPHSFLQITGLRIVEFDEIVSKVRGDVERLEAEKKCHGRNSHLATIEDKILCIFVYYRTYITHTFLGYLFNLHNSNICRVLKKLEPIMANKITIKKDRSLTPEKLLKMLADVTEQRTQRPSKKKKKSY